MKVIEKFNSIGLIKEFKNNKGSNELTFSKSRSLPRLPDIPKFRKTKVEVSKNDFIPFDLKNELFSNA